jgi:hypothetical protein
LTLATPGGSVGVMVAQSRTPDTGHETRVYLSGVASQTHVVYAASYIRSLLASSPGRVVVVDMGLRWFLGERRVSQRDLEELLPDNSRMSLATLSEVGWRVDRGADAIYVAIGSPGSKALLRLRATNPLRRLPVIVVDEGLGSHGTWRTRREAMLREGGRPARSTVRALISAATRAVMTTRRWSLYERENGRFVVNPDVSREFLGGTRTGPGSRGAVFSADHRPLGVFLSQPWVELGVLDNATYVGHLADLTRAAAEVGVRLRVLPHPAEDTARFAGLDALVHHSPAELDAVVSDAAVVLGASSTALLNLAAVHGMPAIRVSLPQVSLLDADLSTRQRELLDQYLSPPIAIGQLGLALAMHLPSVRPPTEASSPSGGQRLRPSDPVALGQLTQCPAEVPGASDARRDGAAARRRQQVPNVVGHGLGTRVDGISPGGRPA